MQGWIGLGDAAMSAGTLREADAAFRTDIGLARRTNDEREISVGLNGHGDVLVAQGNLPEALKSYRDGLAIADRLAKSDPGNGTAWCLCSNFLGRSRCTNVKRRDGEQQEKW